MPIIATNKVFAAAMTSVNGSRSVWIISLPEAATGVRNGCGTGEFAAPVYDRCAHLNSSPWVLDIIELALDVRKSAYNHPEC